MSQGRTKAAVRLLEKKTTGTPLQLEDMVDVSSTDQRLVKYILAEKHPSASPAFADFIVDTEPLPVHPAICNDLDARSIRIAALHMKGAGAAGLSGVVERGWMRLCCSFGSASEELCKVLVSTARRLCTSLVDPKCLSDLVECTLIALNKNPGICPIFVGETVRHILAKAILYMTRGDLQDVTGTVQLCSGQLSGI